MRERGWRLVVKGLERDRERLCVRGIETERDSRLGVMRQRHGVRN